MNILNFKKFHLLVVLAVVVLAVIFAGGFFRAQKIEREQKRKVFDACLESLSNISQEDLAKLSAPDRERLVLFSRYLGCKFSWFASPELLDKYNKLVDLANFNPESKQVLAELFDRVLRDLAPEGEFVFNFPAWLLKDHYYYPDMLCPHKALEEDYLIWWEKNLLNLGYPQTAIEFAANELCSSIWHYADNPHLLVELEEETVNFSDWPSDSLMRRITYRLKNILVVRFLNQKIKEAPPFCQSLPLSEEVNSCQEFWSELMAVREIGILKAQNLFQKQGPFSVCQARLKALKETICSQSIENY